jgi:hypothetical protein
VTESKVREKRKVPKLARIRTSEHNQTFTPKCEGARRCTLDCFIAEVAPERMPDFVANDSIRTSGIITVPVLCQLANAKDTQLKGQGDTNVF